jgi:iron(III) transport system substrate-binding protein
MGSGGYVQKLVLLACCLAAGCSSKEVVVVYSPHGTPILPDYEARFEAAYPEVDLQWLDIGFQEVYSRLSAERSRPAADVWWGAPSTLFVQAAKEGLLEAYRPTWADAVAAEFRDPQDLWYATYRSPLAIMFNDRALKADEVPQTWDDLLKPEWKGRVTLRQPLPSGTMRTFLSAMIARAPNEDAGIEWLRQLHAQTVSYPESPNLLFDHLKKNEDRITVWLMPDAVMQRNLHGFPFGYHIPPDTPVLTDGIAIVKGAPHPEWARKFYEFVTTEEALVHQAEAYAKLPAREDIPAEKLPAALVQQPIQPMALDWALLAEKEKAWCARWEHEVYEAR